jgi:hypothetical protein
LQKLNAEIGNKPKKINTRNFGQYPWKNPPGENQSEREIFIISRAHRR